MESERTKTASATSSTDLREAVAILRANANVMVLTGAGCSTASGLGDYRDKSGQWKRKQPITGQVFRADKAARHRYWARSAVGWPVFSQAMPSLAHQALVKLENIGVVQHLVTQNVDQLHQQAGQKAVIDLHGVLSSVSCLSCGWRQSRDDFQLALLENNPWLSSLNASYAPDGDADLQTDAALQAQVANMQIPTCQHCEQDKHDSGSTIAMMKPDVVFFGENIPSQRKEMAMEQLHQADVLVVAGSSLMVFSGYRFCREALQRKQSIIIVNNGATRADDIATVKVGGDCGSQLNSIAEQLA